MHAVKCYPRERPKVLPFQDSRYGENRRKCRQVPRIQILVHHVECGPSHWNRQQPGHETDRPPTRLRRRKENTAQLPAGQQQQEERSSVPHQQSGFEGQMRRLERKRNQVRKQRHVGV